MQVQTHLLAGWCFANVVSLTPRERLFCLAVSLLPDFDGLGILIDVSYYQKWHHILGHNIFFGIIISLLFSFFTARPFKAAVLFFLLFHLHLALDLLGSGPGWGIFYFWPLSQTYFESPYVWDLQSWQTTVVFALLIVWTLVIAYRQKRTPLECIAPGLDTRFTNWFSEFVDR